MVGVTPGPGMLTAGIDLSADPRKTGVATLSWVDDCVTATATATATVMTVEIGRHSDADLADLRRLMLAATAPAFMRSEGDPRYLRACLSQFDAAAGRLKLP